MNILCCGQDKKYVTLEQCASADSAQYFIFETLLNPTPSLMMTKMMK